MLQSLIGHITPYALWRVYEQLQIFECPSLQHPCHQFHLDSLGLPCYHIIQERTSQNQLLYLHDFHRRWFFITPPDDFIQVPLCPILNPQVVKTKGRPKGSKKQQTASSTQRDPSEFEATIESQKRKGVTKQKERKRTRTGRKRTRKEPTPETESSEGVEGDSAEDALVSIELDYLVRSGGRAGPLWAEMEEFASMNKATQAFTRRSRRVANKTINEYV